MAGGVVGLHPADCCGWWDTVVGVVPISNEEDAALGLKGWDRNISRIHIIRIFTRG